MAASYFDSASWRIGNIAGPRVRGYLFECVDL